MLSPHEPLTHLEILYWPYEWTEFMFFVKEAKYFCFKSGWEFGQGNLILGTLQINWTGLCFQGSTGNDLYFQGSALHISIYA